MKISIGKKNEGFTLVELIVVLVILAILAAILIPALLGYIDKAREKKYLLNAKACMDAAQARFTEAYGSSTGVPAEGTPVISGARKASTSGNEDQDFTGTDFAKELLEYVGKTGSDEPYCFMVGVGSNAKDTSTLSSKTTKHDKYIVYYAFYVEKKGSTKYYYYNGEWQEEHPRANNTEDIFTKKNVVQVGPLKGKRIQYYLITNHTNLGGDNPLATSTFWDYVKKKDQK